MARDKARLSDLQKRRATRIAREKGLTCPDCGSSEPVPKEARCGRAQAAVPTLRCAAKTARVQRRRPSSSPLKRQKLSAYTPCEIYRKRLNNPLHYGAPLR